MLFYWQTYKLFSVLKFIFAEIPEVICRNVKQKNPVELRLFWYVLRDGNPNICLLCFEYFSIRIIGATTHSKIKERTSCWYVCESAFPLIKLMNISWASEYFSEKPPNVIEYFRQQQCQRPTNFFSPMSDRKEWARRQLSLERELRVSRKNMCAQRRSSGDRLKKILRTRETVS